MTEKFSGIILGGGSSRRMGRDKTQLQLQGKTLLEWQVNKLRAAGASEILLCGVARCDIPKVRCVPDILPRRGPLGGIYTGLLSAEYPDALILSADVPLLPVETLHTLLDLHEADATLLRHGRQTEPLIGVYRCALAPMIQPLIREHSASVWALLDQCDWETVEYKEEEALLCNCNTPEDFEEAIRIAKRFHIQ